MEKAIADNEAHAKAEREAIAALEAHAKAPISLPTPDAIVERALDLDAMLAGAPLRAREALRRFFQGGNIILTPDHEKGHYVAKAEFLPLVALSELAANKITKPPAGSRGPSGTSVGCAGRI
ncbi:MAG TPA: hypothetical protein ENK57_13985 [Polyangiaceae bacterium]|nr:hypothetical protein [Polyangiaceae bacterium]